MRRDKGLVPLSREHNRALLLARNARRAARTGEPGHVHRAWEELASAYRKEIHAHFDTEERLVLPLLRDLRKQSIAERLLREHRAMARNIETPARWTRDRLAALADVLYHHVRFEEREVFPLVQRHASPDLLAALGKHAQAEDSPQDTDTFE